MKKKFDIEDLFTCECGYCGELFESLQEDDTICPNCGHIKARYQSARLHSM